MKKTIKAYINLLLTESLSIAVIAGFALFFDKNVALAAFIGGFIAIISNLIFTGVCFIVPGLAQNSKKILTAFYMAEAIKFFIIILLFALVILCLKIPFLPLFVTYFVTYILFSWIGLIFLRK